jgi:hypothetical protein
MSNGNKRPGDIPKIYKLEEFLDRSIHFYSKKSTDESQNILDFLMAHKKEFSITHLQKENLKPLRIKNAEGGIYHFQQWHNGIQVDGASITVECKDGYIEYIKNHTRELKIKEHPSGTPLLSKHQAVQKALNAFDKTHHTNYVEPVEVKFLHFGDEDILTYLIRIESNEIPGAWILYIDAYSGDILTKEPRIRYQGSVGHGKVISPNPVVQAGRTDLRSLDACGATCGMYEYEHACTPPTDFSTPDHFNALKKPVSFNHITLDNTGCRLNGLHVIVYIRDYGLNDEIIYVENKYQNPNELDFPINEIDYECLMVYFHIDSFRDYLESFFNYYDINIKLQAVAIIDKKKCVTNEPAWYYPRDYTRITDPPLNRGYLCFFRKPNPCDNDAGEDADVILHEYTHALFDNILKNTQNTSGSEYDAFEEAMSSFLPMIFLAPSNPFNYGVWGDWMQSNGLYQQDFLNDVGREDYRQWLARRPSPTADNYAKRSWTDGGGIILDDFLMESYDDACEHAPSHSITKMFTKAAIRTILLLGPVATTATLKEASELFIYSITRQRVEKENLKNMLTLINQKKLISFYVTNIDVLNPILGAWTGLDPRSMDICLLTQVGGNDIWLDVIDGKIFLAIRTTNRDMFFQKPAVLFIIDVEIYVRDISGEERLKTETPIRIIGEDLASNSSRIMRTRIDNATFASIGDREFCFVINIITPYNIVSRPTNWHSSPKDYL